MAGGLLQLVAYGAQDVYISGNPHITFWKILYKRHTNFAMEAFRVNFTGAPAFGQRVVAVVNRNADLIGKTYLEVVLPAKDTTGATIDPIAFWNDQQSRFGYLLIKQIEVEIGGQVIDRHYGEWLYLWECLTSCANESIKLDWMVSAEYSTSTVTDCQGRPRVLYIPLQFWFCRNPGLAIPLIALQFHEVHFNLIFNNVTQLLQDPSPANVAKCPTLFDASLYIDYVYLDTEEHQPSGTCNFSRIDNATFVFDCVTSAAAAQVENVGPGSYPDKTHPFHFRMYAVSYNILRIMSGMGGLAYSN